MDRTNNRSTLGFLVMLMTATLFLVGLTVISSPSNAQASGCAAGTICGGTGSGGNGGGGNGSGSGGSGGSGGTGGTGNGGGGGNPDPFMWSVRRVPDGSGGSLACAVRDDGKASTGADYIYTKRFGEGTSEVTPPDVTHYWTYLGYSQGFGFLYERNDFVARNCLYPPRTHKITVECLISNSVEITQTLPVSKYGLLETKTQPSGYSEGSMDYNSCVNSSGEVSLSKPVTEYGFYELRTWNRTAFATVEVATTPDDITGVIPAPKIIGLSPAYTSGKVLKNTASLDCRTPNFHNPGVEADYSETACSSQNSKNPSYVCAMPSTKMHVMDQGKMIVQNIPNGGKIELMRDGARVKTDFGQSVSGKGIRVNSYSTKFLRSATSQPWVSSLPTDENLFELRTNNQLYAKSVLVGNGTSTATLKGNVGTVWLTGYYAADHQRPTKITQELTWEGTRTIQSGIMTVNSKTGVMSWTPTTIVKPTFGVCNQSIVINYTGVHGDIVS